jgi:hypothetical protein
MAQMQRFRWWVVEWVASIIVLVSFLSYRYNKGKGSEWSTEDTWLFTIPTISSLLSFLGIVFSVFQRDVDAVCRIESQLVWSVTALWTISAIVATVGPINGLPIDSYESFINDHPNLYFFCFWALLVSIILVASWFNQYIYGEEVENSISTQWILLGAISFLSMLRGISFRDARLTDYLIEDLGNGTTYNTTIVVPICETGVYTCDRVTFTIILSAVSATTACVMTPWKGNSRKCQADVGITLFIAWLFGIAFVTFDSGPGVQLGSLYISSYINLFLCLDIVIQSTAGSNGKKIANPSSSVVGRGAIFDAAYTQLERMNPDTQEHPDRSASYKDLFENVTLMSTSEGDDHEETIPPATRHRRSYIDLKYQAIQVNRLELWCILIIESCVNVAALVPNLSGPWDRSFPQKGILTLPSLSIIISFVGIATCMRKTNRANIIQIASVIMAVLTWLAAIPVLSRFVDFAIFGNKQNSTEATNEANLFFSTWISVIVVLLLCTNLFHASIVTSDWVLLSAFSFALLASTVVTFNSNISTEMDDAGRQVTVPLCTDYAHIKDSTCKGSTLSFYLGLFSGIVSLLMIPLYKCGPWLHFLVAIPLVAIWGVAVVYITFSAKDSGSAGVFYFSSWYVFYDYGRFPNITSKSHSFLINREGPRRCFRLIWLHYHLCC